MWPPSPTTKEVRTSSRPGTERRRSPVHPGRSPCANVGHPRTARRGRHVVWGLRTGTPDAEHPTYTTVVARLVTRLVRAEDERLPSLIEAGESLCSGTDPGRSDTGPIQRAPLTGRP